VATRSSTARLCTSCDTPHVTADWYRSRGGIECKRAHEDRIRRETRERYDEELGFNGSRMGYADSTRRRGRVRYVGPGVTTRDDQ
jgi:hypothetical protein